MKRNNIKINYELKETIIVYFIFTFMKRIILKKEEIFILNIH